jgi:hypothetical protein
VEPGVLDLSKVSRLFAGGVDPGLFVLAAAAVSLARTSAVRRGADEFFSLSKVFSKGLTGAVETELLTLSNEIADSAAVDTDMPCAKQPLLPAPTEIELVDEAGGCWIETLAPAVALLTNLLRNLVDFCIG